MDYIFCNQIKEQEHLRASFNRLTRQTFGFDFTDWYTAGHWRDDYLPHCLTDDDRVISNISVNRMPFLIDGIQKHYIQLGTVMTDPAYRNKGCSRWLMEDILTRYQADGFYLFGNDAVLDFYPKFGFKPAKEFEYYLPCSHNAEPYQIKKIHLRDMQTANILYNRIEQSFHRPDPNTVFRMNGNLSLYQFWLANGYNETLYYLPQIDGFILAEASDGKLNLHQTFCEKRIDPHRLASAFGTNELIFGFLPSDREQYCCREHQEADCTLFLLGDDFNSFDEQKQIFPILSHA